MKRFFTARPFASAARIGVRRPLILVAATLFTATPAIGQATPPPGPPPTIPGTAVVTQGPLTVDTIPILCHNAEQPDQGFMTESSNAEWAPEVDLTLWPTPGASDSLTITFKGADADYDATFTRGTHASGPLLAGVNLVPWDTGRGFDLYFMADCSERLVR